MAISTLLLGMVIFILCLFIGRIGDKRLKNKNKTNVNKNQAPLNCFGITDDEIVNNIF